MNRETEQQLPMDPYRNMHAERRDGRGHLVHADAGMQAYSFGPFRVVPYSRLLERRGSPVTLGSRAFDLLCLLISRPGEVVTKRELMAGVWPNATVEDGNLRFHVCVLRRALGEHQCGIRYVVNVPGRGYCFVASVGREVLL